MPKLDLSLKGELTPLEMNLIRTGVGLVLLVSVYGGFTIYLNSQMNEKMNEIETTIAGVNRQIEQVNSDRTKIENNISKYSSMITKLEDLNNQASETAKLKNAIPNLLNQIMNVVDETVQIASIENTTDKHIVIVAKSYRYPGLGYFKTRLKTNNILQNVVSGSSMKQDGVISVTIEGDLP